MNICVVGTGYVGLVTGTCLADFGMNVTCVDKNADKIEQLNRGETPIYEIGLTDLIRRNQKLDRLHFTTNLEEAVDRCLTIFVAVGTPEEEGGRADLSQVFDVVKQIATTMDDYKIIAIKSTVPVGTAAKVKNLVKENLKKPVDFDVVSNPEFLREGAAINDFLRPDRIILGAESERAMAIMRDIYRPLYLLKKPFVCTSNQTAELIKYAANTMLALRISFINEIANLCEKVDADVYDVAIAIGMDNRIGPKFLHPGPGFGGSCFPKDVKSLINIGRDNDYPFRIAEAIVAVNQAQREKVVEKSTGMLGSLKDKTIGILGLAFKPNTDDIRESPAVYAAARFIEEGASVRAYDPAAMEQTEKELPKINFCRNPYEVCEGADLVLLMTEWNEFRDLDLARIKESMKTPNLFDTRNIYEPVSTREMGFNFICTGRGKI